MGAEEIRKLAYSACVHYWNCDNQCNEHRLVMARLAKAVGYHDPATNDDVNAILNEGKP